MPSKKARQARARERARIKKERDEALLAREQRAAAGAAGGGVAVGVKPIRPGGPVRPGSSEVYGETGLSFWHGRGSRGGATAAVSQAIPVASTPVQAPPLPSTVAASTAGSNISRNLAAMQPPTRTPFAINLNSLKPISALAAIELGKQAYRAAKAVLAPPVPTGPSAVFSGSSIGAHGAGAGVEALSGMYDAVTRMVRSGFPNSGNTPGSSV